MMNAIEIITLVFAAISLITVLVIEFNRYLNKTYQYEKINKNDPD